MKFYEYGIRTHRLKGVYNEEKVDAGAIVMHNFTKLGIRGWENYNIVKDDDRLHFFFRREITINEAEKLKEKGLNEILGFVDHPK